MQLILIGVRKPSEADEEEEAADEDEEPSAETLRGQAAAALEAEELRTKHLHQLTKRIFPVTSMYMWCQNFFYSIR